MLKVRLTAPATLPAGTKLRRLAVDLLDDRRHLVRQLAPGIHELVKPATFAPGDELTIDGEILGPPRAAMTTEVDGKSVSLGVYYARRDDDLSRTIAANLAKMRAGLHLV